MAWYALYKWFIQFRKPPYVNSMHWYSHYLYEEWFSNLSEEEQKQELEYQEELRRKRKSVRKQKAALAELMLTRAYDAALKAWQ